MRKIAFRAWSVNDKKMFYGTYLCPGNMIVDENDKVIGHLGIDAYLMQFTGHIDKNGEVIYEGDIIVSQEQTRVVKYNNNLAQFIGTKKERIESVDDWITLEFISEVIGNIYETTGLINKQ